MSRGALLAAPARGGGRKREQPSAFGSLWGLNVCSIWEAGARRLHPCPPAPSSRSPRPFGSSNNPRFVNAERSQRRSRLPLARELSPLCLSGGKRLRYFVGWKSPSFPQGFTGFTGNQAAPGPHWALCFPPVLPVCRCRLSCTVQKPRVMAGAERVFPGSAKPPEPWLLSVPGPQLSQVGRRFPII